VCCGCAAARMKDMRRTVRDDNGGGLSRLGAVARVCTSICAHLLRTPSSAAAVLRTRVKRRRDRAPSRFTSARSYAILRQPWCRPATYWGSRVGNGEWGVSKPIGAHWKPGGWPKPCRSPGESLRRMPPRRAARLPAVVEPLIFSGPIDPNIPVRAGAAKSHFIADVGLPDEEVPAQSRQAGKKRQKRTDLFGKTQTKATPVQPAPPKAAAPTPRTTSTTAANGQQTHNVTSSHDMHRHFATGGWGELCTQFLVEHGVPALPTGTVARMAACARGTAPEPPPAVASADAAALNAREKFVARQLADLATEQTARIAHNIYVVEEGLPQRNCRSRVTGCCRRF